MISEEVYKHLGKTYLNQNTDLKHSIVEFVADSEYLHINKKYISIIWNVVDGKMKYFTVSYVYPEEYDKKIYQVIDADNCSVKKPSVINLHCENCNIPLPNWFIIKSCPMAEVEAFTKELQTKIITKNNNKNFYKKSIEEINKQKCIKRMIAGAKKRATKKKLDFNITEEDVSIPEKCPVLDSPFYYDGDLHPLSPSLDRIDSSMGYIKGNVKVISHRANSLKNNMSTDDLIALGKYVENAIKEKE